MNVHKKKSVDHKTIDSVFGLTVDYKTKLSIFIGNMPGVAINGLMVDGKTT
jgi:hypothetical protein